MKKLNYIEEDDLLLERPNIREKCNIRSDEGMQEYLILYNTYNNLLIQFLMKEYSLINVDNELAKRKDEYKELSYEEKDMYQKSASGYLKYFYLRNNIYIERLSIEERDYLNNVYLTGNFSLNEEREKFIKKTYLKVILENPDSENSYINYGPNNGKFIKPSNAIIIGIRYDEFNNLTNKDGIIENYSKTFFNLQMLIDFLEYKIKREKSIPFYVIKYDEFSINCRKNKNRGV